MPRVLIQVKMVGASEVERPRYASGSLVDRQVPITLDVKHARQRTEV
jgi:hypothetical protein